MLAAKAAPSFAGCVRRRIVRRQVERGDPSPLLLSGEAHVEHCVRFWVLPYEREVEILEQVQ